MTSEPQPGALEAVRLAGRSTSFRDGWAAVEISAAGAALGAVLTGQSLGFGDLAGRHKIGSAGLAQPSRKPGPPFSGTHSLAFAAGAGNERPSARVMPAFCHAS